MILPVFAKRGVPVKTDTPLKVCLPQQGWALDVVVSAGANRAALAVLGRQAVVQTGVTGHG